MRAFGRRALCLAGCHTSYVDEFMTASETIGHSLSYRLTFLVVATISLYFMLLVIIVQCDLPFAQINAISLTQIIKIDPFITLL